MKSFWRRSYGHGDPINDLFIVSCPSWVIQRENGSLELVSSFTGSFGPGAYVTELSPGEVMVRLSDDGAFMNSRGNVVFLKPR